MEPLGYLVLVIECVKFLLGGWRTDWAIYAGVPSCQAFGVGGVSFY